MTREFTISCGAVSAKLVEEASALIVHRFGGYFRTDGRGGYTFKNGETIEESSVRFTVATSESALAVDAFISKFARDYCKNGNQESVYYRDFFGRVLLANKYGDIAPL